MEQYEDLRSDHHGHDVLTLELSVTYQQIAGYTTVERTLQLLQLLLLVLVTN